MLFLRPLIKGSAFLLASVLLSAAPATAQSTDTGFGALQNVLPDSGQDDTWRFANTGDSFEIENIGDPQAITYFYAIPKDGTEGRRVIELDIALHPDSQGSAGLLYGLNRSGDLYHMLTLDASGQVSVFRRDSSGVRPMIQRSSEAFLPEKLNRLSIQENGDEITYFLNGTSLGSLGGDLFGSGATGIAAVGDVRAFFTHFSDGSGADRSDLAPATDNRQIQQASQGAETLHMKPVQIVDTEGPAGPIVAYETLVPAQWQTKGGVKWSHADSPGRCFTGARLVWGAGTADQRYGMAFMDPVSWGMTSNGPSRHLCMPMDLTDAEMVMRAYFDAISATMQVTIRDVQRPAELQPLLDMVGGPWKAAWSHAQAWVDGVVIEAGVQTSTGQHDAYFVAVTKHAQASHGQITARDGATALVMTFVTPPGELENGHPAFGAILNNLRVNPQWKQIEAQWWSQRLRQERPGQVTAAAPSNSSVGDMMFDSWKRREGMRDAGHAKSVNGIWEVQPWQSASGKTVLLNQNYAHAWQLQNGSIVMTNNANFNPMQSLNQTGQELRRAQ